MLLTYVFAYYYLKCKNNYFCAAGAADGPLYSAEPKPSIKKPTKLNSHKATTPKTSLLPNDLARSIATTKLITKFTKGTKNSNNHQPGRPIIFNKV